MAANQAMRTMNKTPPPSRSKNCTNNARAIRPSTTSPTRQMLAGLRRTSRMDGGLGGSSVMGRSNRISQPLGIESEITVEMRNLASTLQGVDDVLHEQRLVHGARGRWRQRVPPTEPSVGDIAPLL